MKTITTEELHHRIEAGPVAVFDVRGDVNYEIGHLPGAKTAPCGSLTFRVASIMNPDSFVVVYSRGGECREGEDAAERLEGLGMTNVHWYQDGLSGWEAAGHEVVPSLHPKLHTQGPVQEVRGVIVDRSKAYGGAFKGKPIEVGGAGG